MVGTDKVSDGDTAHSQSAYNLIFEKFVGTPDSVPDDVVGIIGYGLYKHAKREWTSAFREREQRDPSPDDTRAYHLTWTASQITNARSTAEQVMAAYADDVISKEEPRILRDAVRGKFWPGIFSSMLENFLYTVALIAVAFVLSRAGIDVIGLLSTTSR